MDLITDKRLIVNRYNPEDNSVMGAKTEGVVSILGETFEIAINQPTDTDDGQLALVAEDKEIRFTEWKAREVKTANSTLMSGYAKLRQSDAEPEAVFLFMAYFLLPFNAVVMMGVNKVTAWE